MLFGKRMTPIIRACVFLDFKKAFNTVDQKMLLSKFDFYGIRGVLHEWLKSNLSERNQITFNLIRWFSTATTGTKPIIVSAGHVYILLHQREK